VVIDWFNNKACLHVLVLQNWKDKVKDLVKSFSYIQAFHIHRSFNSMADKLSKISLSSNLGFLHVEEYVGDELISSWSLSIF